MVVFLTVSLVGYWIFNKNTFAVLGRLILSILLSLLKGSIQDPAADVFPIRPTFQTPMVFQGMPVGVVVWFGCQEVRKTWAWILISVLVVDMFQSTY
jgi:hypothetical protein